MYLTPILVAIIFILFIIFFLEKFRKGGLFGVPKELM